MKKNKIKTVKDFANTLVGKITVIIVAIYIVTSILPELLNAQNDLAVTIGIVSALAIAFCVFKFWNSIMDWLKS